MASVLVLRLFALLFVSCLNSPASSAARKLSALVEQQPLVLKYHKGDLLKGNFSVNIVWYGRFSAVQRSILIDFVNSLSPQAAVHERAPSVSSWWKTTEKYNTGVTTLSLGNQIVDANCSLGKLLRSNQISRLARRVAGGNAIAAVFTTKDVAVEGFCMSRCGTHGSVRVAGSRTPMAYVWVGNSESQCPGQCAWPFHQPVYGPQAPPLVAPNSDVGVDGMVINLATVLAGAVTNPFRSGYFMGPVTAPLEAASACTGTFATGAYPGYAGNVLVDTTTGGSFNARGRNGRKFLLPALWDPTKSACSTLV